MDAHAHTQTHPGQALRRVRTEAEHAVAECKTAVAEMELALFSPHTTPAVASPPARTPGGMPERVQAFLQHPPAPSPVEQRWHAAAAASQAHTPVRLAAALQLCKTDTTMSTRAHLLYARCVRLQATGADDVWATPTTAPAPVVGPATVMLDKALHSALHVGDLRTAADVALELAECHATRRPKRALDCIALAQSCLASRHLHSLLLKAYPTAARCRAKAPMELLEHMGPDTRIDPTARREVCVCGCVCVSGC